VLQERLYGQRAAGGFLDQLGEAGLRPLAVHLFAQPAEQRAEVAAADRLQQARDLGLRRAEQLRRQHGAQRVAREVAEGAAGPVDVLQAAQPVVGRNDAEEIPHPLVPGARQVAHGEVARDQRAFEAVAQDDVQRVGRLVGLDADEAALDAAVDAHEVVRGERRVVAERGAQLAGEEADEGGRAAGLHLDQQRLALVHGDAARLADRLAGPGPRQARLVERVPGLVQDAHE
jgi:hypothetical protein